MKTIKYILIFSFLLVSLSSCEDFLDINENPNAAVEPPLKGLLSNTTYNSALNVFRLGATTSYLTQYLASPNSNSTTDTHQRGDYSGTWSNFYGVMADLYDMNEIAEGNGSVQYAGVAKILMAANLGLVVDVWGDVPYSESFTFETITPSYDAAADVYGQIMNLLDAGIADLESENTGELLAEANDFIHAGEASSWIRTANALKARYMIHLSNESGFDASAVLSTLANAYTSNADDAEITTFNTRNPWAQVAVDNDALLLGGWLSEQYIDAMNGTTFGIFDPRLPIVTDPIPDGTFVGTENGAGRKGDGTVQEECYLTTNGFYSSDNAALSMISYSELKFIEAEAKLLSGDADGALTAYMEAIEANMLKLGVSDYAAYMADPSVNVASSELNLEKIFQEKYKVLFLHPEAWVDMRRNDFNYQDLSLPVGHNTNLGGEWMCRFDYPDTEYGRNGNNVPTVDLTTKIFWDK